MLGLVALDAWIFVKALALLFLANGVYGVVTGRVYGRSWQHYWGGWIHRTEAPFQFWSYALGHLLIGAFLLFLRR